MPTLKYLGESFDCATAIKGADYIHLLDDNGVMVAAFDAITDFSGFTLENGSYTSPTEEHNCKVAVIRDDGTIGVGSHTCADIGNAVPQTRKVNGKPLSADVTLTATELGAAAASDVYTKAQTMTSATAGLFGLGADAVPDDVFTKIKNLIGANAEAIANGAKIATGSYTGTGTYGASNPNSLTFDFAPKFVIIKPSYTAYGEQIPQLMGVWLNGMTIAPVLHGSLAGSSGNPIFSVSGKVLSWYADPVRYQLNESGVTYRYFAIG